jgi:hypothetical protein
VRIRLVAGVALLALALSACSSSDDDAADPAEGDAATTTTAAAAPAAPIVFNGQGNDLAAYESKPPFKKQIVIPHRDDEHPDGLDINAQICFDPKNPTRFVAGEDTLQETTGEPGWGIFDLSGTEVGALSAKQVGKLVPTYQGGNDNPENYGCGFLSDGRIVTTDVGNQAAGPGDGQLIVWFPPFDSRDVKYCKLDVALVTGQSVLVDGDAVYVAQSRPPAAGIYKYDATTFPTDATPAGGCDGKDGTGAPMATKIAKTKFVVPDETNGVATPAGIAKAKNGNFYVSSVFTGTIAEFDSNGEYVRTILKPAAGDALGAEPFKTGTPLGIGVAPDGTLFVADIGIVATADGIGPGRGTGHVRRITFDAQGEPSAPEIMDSDLAFPDGIGIFTGS